MNQHRKQSYLKTLKQRLIAQGTRISETEITAVSKLTEGLLRNLEELSEEVFLADLNELLTAAETVLKERLMKARLLFQFFAGAINLAMTHSNTKLQFVIQGISDCLQKVDHSAYPLIRNMIRASFASLCIEIITNLKCADDNKPTMLPDRITKSFIECSQQSHSNQQKEGNYSGVINIKNTILPKLEIGLATGSFTVGIASRSSRRQNLSSFSVRNSPLSQRFGLKKLNFLAQSLGQTMLTGCVEFLIYKHREKRLETQFGVTASGESEKKIEMQSDRQELKDTLFNSKSQDAFVKAIPEKAGNLASSRRSSHHSSDNRQLLKITGIKAGPERLTHSRSANAFKNSISSKARKASKKPKCEPLNAEAEPRADTIVDIYSGRDFSQAENLSKETPKNDSMRKSYINNVIFNQKSKANLTPTNARTNIRSFKAQKGSFSNLLKFKKSSFLKSKNEFPVQKHVDFNFKNNNQQGDLKLKKEMNKTLLAQPETTAVNYRSNVSVRHCKKTDAIAAPIPHPKQSSPIFRASARMSRSFKEPDTKNDEIQLKFHCDLYGRREKSDWVIEHKSVHKDTAFFDEIRFEEMLLLLKHTTPFFEGETGPFISIFLHLVTVKKLSKKMLKMVTESLKNDVHFSVKLSLLTMQTTSIPALQTIIFLLKNVINDQFLVTFGEAIAYLKDAVLVQSDDHKLSIKLLCLVGKLLLILPQHRLFFTQLFLLDSNLVLALENALQRSNNFVHSPVEQRTISKILKITVTLLNNTPKEVKNYVHKNFSRLLLVRVSEDGNDSKFFLQAFVEWLCRIEAQFITMSDLNNYALLFRRCFRYIIVQHTMTCYVRSTYLLILCRYCRDNIAEIDFEVINSLFSLLIAFAKNKRNENVASVFSQIKILRFLSKELDLNHEWPFIRQRFDSGPLVCQRFNKSLFKKQKWTPTASVQSRRLFSKPSNIIGNGSLHKSGCSQSEKKVHRPLTITASQLQTKSRLGSSNCFQTAYDDKKCKTELSKLDFGQMKGLDAFGRHEWIDSDTSAKRNLKDAPPPQSNQNPFPQKCLPTIEAENKSLSFMCSNKKDSNQCPTPQQQKYGNSNRGNQSSSRQFKDCRSDGVLIEANPVINPSTNLVARNTLHLNLSKVESLKNADFIKITPLNLPINTFDGTSDNQLQKSMAPIGKQQKVYTWLKDQRPIHKNVKLHAQVVRLVMLLLLSKSLTSLEEVLTGQYPVQNNKRNYLYILKKHLSSNMNSAVVQFIFSGLHSEMSKKARKTYYQKHSLKTTFEQKVSHLVSELCRSKEESIPHEIAAIDREIVHEREFEEHNNDVLESGQLGYMELRQTELCLLKCVTQSFEQPITQLEKIGSGAYSVVKRCSIFGENCLAVKGVTGDRNIFDRNALFYLFNEISILVSLSSQNVCPDTIKSRPKMVELLDYGLTKDDQFQLLFPCYSPKVDTFKNLKNTLLVFYDIVCNVKELHSQRIVHYDIKADNVLRYGDKHLLVDFGECLKNEQSFRLRGTELIRSPEMVHSRLENFDVDDTSKEINFKDLVGLFNRQSKFHSGTACDIWALGCLLYELFTGEMLFLEKDWTMFYKRMRDENGPILTEENLDKIEKNFVLQTLLNFILIRNPQQRPSIDSVFKKVRGACLLMNLEIDLPKKGKECEIVTWAQPLVDDSHLSPSALRHGCFESATVHLGQKLGGFWLTNWCYLQLSSRLEDSMLGGVQFELSSFETRALSLKPQENVYFQNLAELTWEYVSRLNTLHQKCKITADFIVLRADLGFGCQFVGTLFAAVLERKFSPNLLIQIHSKSLYNVIFTDTIVRLLRRVWMLLEPHINDTQLRMIRCACNKVRGSIRPDIHSDASVCCQCSKEKSAGYKSDCLLPFCKRYRKFLRKHLSLTKDQMQWVSVDKGTQTIVWALDDSRMSQDVSTAETSVGQRITYCKECRCVLLGESDSGQKSYAPQYLLEPSNERV